MKFKMGDRVQKGTSPVVYTVVRDQGKTHWVWLETPDGRRFKAHDERDDLCPDQTERDN